MYEGKFNFADETFYNGKVVETTTNQKFSGPIGPSMSYLWDWTLTYRTPLLNTASEHCQVSVQESEQDSTVEDAKLELAQYQALSRPLAR